MKITVTAGNPTPKIQDYEVESALRTLMEARKIRQNTELMAKVVKLAKSQKSAITDIADIKSAYNRMVDTKQPAVKQEDDDLNDDDADKAFEAQIQADE